MRVLRHCIGNAKRAECPWLLLSCAVLVGDKGWPRVGVWDFIRSGVPPVDVVGEEMRIGIAAPSKSVTSTIALVECCEVHERLL
jgi:hypothetical protein